MNRREFIGKTCKAVAVALVAPVAVKKVWEAPYLREFHVGTSAAPAADSFGGFLVPDSFRDEIIMAYRTTVDIALRHPDSFVILSDTDG